MILHTVFTMFVGVKTGYESTFGDNKEVWTLKYREFYTGTGHIGVFPKWNENSVNSTNSGNLINH